MSNQKQDTRSRFWRKPGRKWLLGIPLGGFIAFGLGAVALGSMNFVLHETSKTEFCYTCHSHQEFIRPEYEASSHFINQAGVRAGCSNCHLPHDNWFELVWTKAVVSLDIIPEVMGKLDTAEKYESHRAEMAESVWRQFKSNPGSPRSRGLTSTSSDHLASAQRELRPGPDHQWQNRTTSSRCRSRLVLPPIRESVRRG